MLRSQCLYFFQDKKERNNLVGNLFQELGFHSVEAGSVVSLLG